MLLRQISPSDPVTSTILDGLEFSAPILRTAQWYARNGSTDHLQRAREGTEQAAYFRALNASANTSTPPTPNPITPEKKIISFDIKVDRAFQDRGDDLLADQLAYQSLIESREAGYVLQSKFFNADSGSVAAEFDGLIAQVDTGDAVQYQIANNGAGALMSLGATNDEVKAKREALIALINLIDSVQGGASHLIMNEDLKSRVIMISKEAGFYRTQKDELGDEVEMIRGAQLVGAGRSKTGAALLPFTETVDGVGANCSSIFAVRWGERVDLSLLTSVGVSASQPYVSGNFWIINVNIDAQIVLQNTRALVQSRGWRLDLA